MVCVREIKMRRQIMIAIMSSMALGNSSSQSIYVLVYLNLNVVQLDAFRCCYVGALVDG